MNFSDLAMLRLFAGLVPTPSPFVGEGASFEALAANSIPPHEGEVWSVLFCSHEGTRVPFRGAFQRPAYARFPLMKT